MSDAVNTFGAGMTLIRLASLGTFPPGEGFDTQKIIYAFIALLNRKAITASMGASSRPGRAKSL